MSPLNGKTVNHGSVTQAYSENATRITKQIAMEQKQCGFASARIRSSALHAHPKEAQLGWYLRKSLSFGPLRINLSRFRARQFGSGEGPARRDGAPRRYLHAGRDGLYYRTSLEQPAAKAPAESDEDGRLPRWRRFLKLPPASRESARDAPHSRPLRLG